ncbi:hypothetical protein [Leucobacter sp. W1153]|uniref:hypothetical protein n=1 Tax=unclassified Leucobacter TaxID=2621730 RepID=UPI003F417BDE
MKAFRLTGRVLAARPIAPVWAERRPAARRGGQGWPLAQLGDSAGAARPEGIESHATPVPWRVVHRTGGVLEIEQRGGVPLRAVRVSLAGGGLLGVSLPRTVHPGERVRVVLRGVYADGALSAPDALLVVRWIQPEGQELLWPISL